LLRYPPTKEYKLDRTKKVKKLQQKVQKIYKMCTSFDGYISLSVQEGCRCAPRVVGG